MQVTSGIIFVLSQPGFVLIIRNGTVFFYVNHTFRTLYGDVSYFTLISVFTNISISALKLYLTRVSLVRSLLNYSGKLKLRVR